MKYLELIIARKNIVWHFQTYQQKKITNKTNQNTSSNSLSCTDDTWNADTIARFKFIEAIESFAEEHIFGPTRPLL